MATKTTGQLPSARARLLTAADELFYEEGITSVGIDRVIEQAGVAKATLYSAFGSKDELVRAYLEGRHLARIDRLTTLLSVIDDPRDRVLAIFDSLGKLFEERGFRGCAFLNAAADARTGSLAESISDEYRGWIRTLFRDLVTSAGADDPELLGRQLVLLYDGAVVSAKMDRDLTAAATARRMAAELLDAAIARGAVTGTSIPDRKPR